MPDYPYVYATAPPRPVQPGGTRVRVLRRGAGHKGARREEGGDEGRDRGPEDEAWRQLLADAVAELNRSFQRAGAPFACVLEEDAEGILLRVRRQGEDGAAEDLDEETMEPHELPLWLQRIRVGLGLIVDETA
jgi:hypothetical protein